MSHRRVFDSACPDGAEKAASTNTPSISSLQIQLDQAAPTTLPREYDQRRRTNSTTPPPPTRQKYENGHDDPLLSSPSPMGLTSRSSSLTQKRKLLNSGNGSGGSSGGNISHNSSMDDSINSASPPTTSSHDVLYQSTNDSSLRTSPPILLSNSSHRSSTATLSSSSRRHVHSHNQMSTPSTLARLLFGNSNNIQKELKNSNHGTSTSSNSPDADDENDNHDVTGHDYGRQDNNAASQSHGRYRPTKSGPVTMRATPLGTGTVIVPPPSSSSTTNTAYSSHTYEPDECEVWRAYIARVVHVEEHQRRYHSILFFLSVEQEHGVQRWLLTFIIGVLQAFIATICMFCTRTLSSWKYDVVAEILHGASTNHAASSVDSNTNNDDDWMASSWGYTSSSSNMQHPRPYQHLYPTTSNNSTALHAYNSNEDTDNYNHMWRAFAVFLLFQTMFGIVASLFVWLEPSSGGSGIPEVKCFLNGIHMPRLLTLSTLLCKMIGITFSVAAGFPIGMEGPMVHCGAIVAALVCQGGGGSSNSNSSGGPDRRTTRNSNSSARCSSQTMLSRCWAWCRQRRIQQQQQSYGRIDGGVYRQASRDDIDDDDDIDDNDASIRSKSQRRHQRRTSATATSPSTFSCLLAHQFGDFRNDREKRDFVACGAAAGVCSAFGSPIGGVLFSLEEASSYFSTKLTWRAFFCAMTSLATVFWIRNADSLWGQANMDRLFSLGDFNSGDSSNFSIWELILFVIVGCFGGMIGAVFNAANEHITLWRMRRVNHSKWRRFVEAILVGLLVSTVSFVMPLLWGKCTELPTDMQDWTNQEKRLVESLVPFRCVPGKEYNEVASLMFTEADTAIKQLLHFRESGSTFGDTRTFSSGALFMFFVPYIATAAVTYGIAIPSGLFVPSLLSGAAFGRLVGHLLHRLDPTNGLFADSGVYALIGAAAVLGGMARMTISLTVILLEATGDMQYVLPLMLAVMAARFTGNVFNEGLYDIHIHLKKIPFLEPDVPAIAERYEMVAGQVMSTEVKCLRPVERVGVVYDLLKSCSHATFPIVDTVSGGTLYGTASRHMLCTLLQRRAFGPPQVWNDEGQPPQPLGPVRLSPLVPWEIIERAYPNYPTIEEIDELNATHRASWLDLRPYANTAPYTVNETASIQRTYRLFRTMGLRFLCVTNHNNQVVGSITRKDLLPASLHESLERRRHTTAVAQIP